MPDDRTRDWNPKDPAVLADQRRAYDELRERCPVAYSDAMSWSLFRHDDVMTVLNDPDTFINVSRHHAIPNAMNGEDHTKHRALLARHFSAPEMATIEPRCRDIAADAINALIVPGSADAVRDIAEPIALRTMCVFLGWPQSTWERVRDWIHGNREATFRRDRDASHRLADKYAAIVTEAMDEHRKHPDGNDLTNQLMNTTVDGHRWNDADVIATLRNWIAGHGTVASAIGLVIAHLASEQEFQQQLRNQPELIPNTIEEILRTDGPLVANARTTARDVVFHRRTIPAGERMSLMWIAANRDPEAFADPTDIQLGRDQTGNLLYGAGIHYCLGAPLARLELRVTTETLLAATTGFDLVPDVALPRETYPGNGFLDVPLALR